MDFQFASESLQFLNSEGGKDEESESLRKIPWRKPLIPEHLLHCLVLLWNLFEQAGRRAS